MFESATSGNGVTANPSDEDDWGEFTQEPPTSSSAVSTKPPADSLFNKGDVVLYHSRDGAWIECKVTQPILLLITPV